MPIEARQSIAFIDRKLSRAVRCGIVALALHGTGALIAAAGSSAEGIVGLPFTRTYSLDEIGEVTRGARLGFDRIGRLAVIRDHSYVVLNDATWIDLAHKGPGSVALLQAANDATGRAFFGALASWGELEYTSDGKLRTRSFRPREYPAWVMATNFYHVVPLPSGVLFGGPNGLVYWDRATGEQAFTEAPDVANVFALGGKVFVSSHSQSVQSLDVATGTLRHLDPRWDGIVIDQVACLDGSRALVFTSGRRLMLFDGENFTAWPSPLGARTSSRVSCLQKLVDGGVAVAIDGQGLYLFSDTGECRLALATTEYHRINDLITREAGVLWLVTEGTVQKLLYGNPVSVVDQRSGVSVSWPQVGYWNSDALIASHGDLYTLVSRPDGLSSRFERMRGQPGGGVWTVAAQGNFSANSGSGFVLGVAGATEPAIYNLQNLTLNSGSRIEIAGPVVLTLNGSLSINSNVTFSAHAPEAFTLQLASGGLTVNDTVVLPATVIAPSGTVTLNGSATLRGTVKADRLIVNSNAALETP